MNIIPVVLLILLKAECWMQLVGSYIPADVASGAWSELVGNWVHSVYYKAASISIKAIHSATKVVGLTREPLIHICGLLLGIPLATSLRRDLDTNRIATSKNPMR